MPVIRAITNEDPNDEEFQQIVATVDQNGDGNITWKEFLDAMTEWLAEDFNSTPQRRKLSADEERADLHLKIKGFFKQFSPSQNFEEIRKKLQRTSLFSHFSLTFVGYGSASSSLMGSNQNNDGTMSSQEKVPNASSIHAFFIISVGVPSSVSRWNEWHTVCVDCTLLFFAI